MKLEAFYNMKTKQDIQNKLQLMNTAAEEHDWDLDDMLMVTGTPYNNLKYIMSSTAGAFVQYHYFTYTDVDTDLMGICVLPSRKQQLIEICKPIYYKIHGVHPNLWVCMTTENTLDIIWGKKVILSDVDNYDILNLGEGFEFLQIDKGLKTSLICLDMYDSVKGVYPMTSEEGFDEWWRSFVEKRGYEGKLDNCYISDLFTVYYSIKNTIFGFDNFEGIETKYNGCIIGG